MNRDWSFGVSARILLASGAFGLALGGLVPASSHNGAAWAQEDGDHEDGDHEDGSGGQGKGKKHGKPIIPEVPVVLPTGEVGAAASAGSGQGGPGNFVRLELGGAYGSAEDASWLPPGYPSDPQVFFDLDMDTSAMVAFGFGRDYGNGWRSEVSVNLFGRTDFEGPWSYTVPADLDEHASMEGSARSLAIMANGYRDFDSGSALTPFVTMGLGIAHNSMNEWTRINPDSDRTRRSFDGGSDTGLAWTVGAGVSWDVGPVFGSAPAKLDLTWRYLILDPVSGSTTATDGSGDDNPVEALNFDLTEHVIAIGLRIPM